jgi:hypothetical protein
MRNQKIEECYGRKEQEELEGIKEHENVSVMQADNPGRAIIPDNRCGPLSLGPGCPSLERVFE